MSSHHAKMLIVIISIVNIAFTRCYVNNFAALHYQRKLYTVTDEIHTTLTPNTTIVQLINGIKIQRELPHSLGMLMQSYKISEDNKISILLANLTDNIFYFDIIPFPYKTNYYRSDYVINNQKPLSIAISGDNKFYSVQKPFNNLLISPLLNIKTFPTCETGLFKNQKEVIQTKCLPMTRYDNRSSIMIHQINDFLYVYTPVGFKFKRICSPALNKTRYVNVIPYTIHPIRLYEGCRLIHKTLIVTKPRVINTTLDKTTPGVVYNDWANNGNNFASDIASIIIAIISIFALFTSLTTGIHGHKQAKLTLKRIYESSPLISSSNVDKSTSMPILTAKSAEV